MRERQEGIFVGELIISVALDFFKLHRLLLENWNSGMEFRQSSVILNVNVPEYS